MKSAVAIKKFIESEPNGGKVSAAELTAFKKACTSDEWDQMGRDACAALGAEWEPSAAAA